VHIDPRVLEILPYPAEVLKRKAEAIPEVTDLVRAVADRMLELMHEAEGIGLAAPQVGVPWRLFVTRHPDDREAEGGRVFINPAVEIIDPSAAEDTEGCLSLPGIEVTVRRPVAVRLTARTLDGADIDEARDDHFARVYQHECDHLDGVLIIDRMTTMDRLRNRRAIRELERA
jgi:peptide deformylase